MSRIAAFWSGLSPNARRGAVGGGLGVLAVALIGALALGGGGDEPAAKPKATTTSTTTEVASSTTAPPRDATYPLTGLPVTDLGRYVLPPLAMKVDNLDTPGESAVPQAGLPRADVVFEEVVEGNITRLVAIFHSQAPGRVGPIRSARTTDVQLLPQLGRPLLGWSGGNEGVTAAVQSSPFIIDAGWNNAPGSYSRQGPHSAPHNLYAEADELYALAPEGTPGATPLFFYRTAGESNPESARKAGGVDLTWGGGGASSPVSWRWDADKRVYVRSQRGRVHTDQSGEAITAKNVVVLVTPYGTSAADSRSPEAQTVGSGELFVFTNGRVIHGTWTRDDIAKPAFLADDDGNVVKLSPGNTWVELPKAGGVSTVFG